MTFQTASPARESRDTRSHPQPGLDPRLIDAWLAELRLEPVERDEREGTTSWDLVLDGRRRFDVRVTLILQPNLVLVAWVHYAPALSDGFRKSYRQFLRWNDELPFAKFALSADERPVLTSELAPGDLDADRLGLSLARLLAICDLLLDESSHWLWPAGRRPDQGDRRCRNPFLFERYRAELAELAATP
ncbi:MAG: YbjN domain-containing protein [Chloroflexota bacterium]|nr:YbjN domain-containing protein [Chloroflexota bacterium]